MLKTVQLIAQKTFVTYSCFWKLTLVNSSPKTFFLSEKFWDKIARGKEHNLSTSLKNVQGAGQRPKAQISQTRTAMQTLKPLPQIQMQWQYLRSCRPTPKFRIDDIREDIHILIIKLFFQKRMRHLNSCIPLWIIMIWKNLIANWEKSLRQWNYIRNISMHWTFHL